ncbi:MAG TPA: hypothetical protein VKT77_08555 [Chthonomonadaceae bacterium]|nr:hypothetical protein [Chthonomonadaceae bacterium]
MNRPGILAGLSIAAVTSIAAAMSLVWTSDARGQASKRPFIPRASDIRPIQPAPAGPPSSASSPGQPGDALAPSPGEHKRAAFDGDDYTYIGNVQSFKNFTYKQDDMTVTGLTGHYNKKTLVLDGEGSLVMDDPKYHVTGEKAHYNDKPDVKTAVILGHVVIVVKPKSSTSPDGANADVDREKSKGATAYCDRLDYFKLKDVALLTGHVIFKQKIVDDDGKTIERTVTADHAEYDRGADKMHLFAPVDLKDTEDQDMHFDRDVYVGTKEGAESVQSDGPFHGHLNPPKDENKGGAKPDEKSKQPGAAAEAAGGTGGARKQPPPAGDAGSAPPKTKP